MTNAAPLTFLKLGGSLITDKSTPLTAKRPVITRIAAEIAQFRKDHPNELLLVGHGSGSFGHAVASRYGTQNGVRTPEEWQGFVEVWAAARKLNQIVMEEFNSAGLPALSFPPSAGLVSENKIPIHWEFHPLEMALAQGLIPVVQGDVVFDRAIGGTIFSTEKVFQYLAARLKPGRILLAGVETGVYTNPEEPEKIIDRITPETLSKIQPKLSGSAATDVTGGMLSKVEGMVALLKTLPDLEIRIFSGVVEGNILRALAGESLGTQILK
jgi:isopentenyl phosphate kinase